MLALCLDSKSKKPEEKKKQSARREPVLAQVFCRVFVAVTSRGSDEEMEFLKAISQSQCGCTFCPSPYFAQLSFRAWSDAHFVSHGQQQPVSGNWRFKQIVEADTSQRPRLIAQSSQHHSNPASHNAVAEFHRLESAVAALGEDSPHASFLLTTTNAASAKLNVPISAQRELSEKYLERARKRLNQADE